MSWLRRAEAEADDLDIRFILLWIGFNAAYAGDIEASASPAPEGERELFQAFFSTLVRFDGHHRVYDMVWERFSQEIRLLLDNRYVYHPFWQHQNGFAGYADWAEKRERSRTAINHALREHKTVKILSILFDRLYVLRNQFGSWRRTLSGNQQLASSVQTRCEDEVQVVPIKYGPIR